MSTAHVAKSASYATCKANKTTATTTNIEVVERTLSADSAQNSEHSAYMYMRHQQHHVYGGLCVRWCKGLRFAETHIVRARRHGVASHVWWVPLKGSQLKFTSLARQQTRLNAQRSPIHRSIRFIWARELWHNARVVESMAEATARGTLCAFDWQCVCVSGSQRPTSHRWGIECNENIKVIIWSALAIAGWHA